MELNTKEGKAKRMGTFEVVVAFVLVTTQVENLRREGGTERGGRGEGRQKGGGRGWKVKRVQSGSMFM